MVNFVLYGFEGFSTEIGFGLYLIILPYTSQCVVLNVIILSTELVNRISSAVGRSSQTDSEDCEVFHMTQMQK